MIIEVKFIEVLYYKKYWYIINEMDFINIWILLYIYKECI